jgi:glycerophosphoryl diester phosphodiesterase
MKAYAFLVTMSLLLFFGCAEEAAQAPRPFDAQGHRGCRGLMPENSIPAFQEALRLGVTTLELDVVITRDSQVLLSHEPFFSNSICKDSTGAYIPDSVEKQYNIFQMSLAETRKFDCGSVPVARFPEQKQISLYKPLLSEVIEVVEGQRQRDSLPLFFYNIETKSQPETDGIFHPEPEAFVDLVVKVLREKGILDRCLLQSFDVRSLQVAHRKYPDLKLVLLVENELSLGENLEKLGFDPDFYSPEDRLVSSGLLKMLRLKNIPLIPWTVNDTSEMRRLMELGVDGLITDYPDRLMEVLKQQNGLNRLNAWRDAYTR